MIEMTDEKIGRVMKNELPIISSSYACLSAAGGEGGLGGHISPARGVIRGVPGRNLMRLSTMTLSPALSPSRMTQSVPIQRPATTGRTVASFLSLTTYTLLPSIGGLHRHLRHEEDTAALARDNARANELPRQ